MQEDVALTEAACPLSKSNYDNHASGKAVAGRTARQALIRQAVYLNHSSPSPQMQSSANVDGSWKKKKRQSELSAGRCALLCHDPQLFHPTKHHIYFGLTPYYRVLLWEWQIAPSIIFHAAVSVGSKCDIWMMYEYGNIPFFFFALLKSLDKTALYSLEINTTGILDWKKNP